MKKIILTFLMTALAFVSVGAVDITDPKYIWDGKIADKIYAYKDTKTIYIYTPGEFIALHDKWEDFRHDDDDQGYKGWTIYLMNDIDLNNHNIQPLTIGWYDGHRFAGNFDGQGHTIPATAATSMSAPSAARWRTTAPSPTVRWSTAR